jgi:hypothetical protein
MPTTTTPDNTSTIVPFVEPSQEEWTRLYAAATRFRDTAPWEWMEETDLFGVQNPETGEIGYGCVLGMGGEHYALAVYLGTAGLHGFWEMRRISQETLFPDPGEVLEQQNCLSASFEDRTVLHSQDRAVIKSLGLKFRGANAWPEFRRYKPGYMPWYLTAPEARFLTLALEQALDVAARFADDARILPRASRTSAFLVRVPTTDAEGVTTWRDERQKPARPAAASKRAAKTALPAELAAQVQEMAESLPRTNGEIEVDYVTLLSPIAGDEEGDGRPYLPHVALILDANSGMILSVEMCSPLDIERRLPEALLNLLGQVNEAGMLPAKISVKRDRTFALLQPYAALLNVELEQSEELPALESAQQSLADFMIVP